VTKYPSIDLLKGVLMLLVMGGHAMELASSHHLALWIGAGFRMPLMIGISGYLLNVPRTRDAAALDLLSRYGRRMLLPWGVATIVYVTAAGWPLAWTTPFDLLLRPPYHLWYVPVLFFLIMVTRLLPFRPLILLAIGAPFSLAIMYGFGLNHAPIYDGILAPDSRFLRYPIYFFFGMLLAERSPPRSALWLTLLLGSLGLAWWAGLYASGQQLAYVPARLLMCLGLIALLPVLSTLPLHAPPVNAIGRESLFFYLWHPLMMGTVILTGIGPLATLALSILLLGIASRLAARNPATALLLGVNPARQQFSSRAPTPSLAPSQ
jgi:fucose 4-O-acetylase-like acetyltransferase